MYWGCQSLETPVSVTRCDGEDQFSPWANNSYFSAAPLGVATCVHRL